jgi:hypothetical protein
MLLSDKATFLDDMNICWFIIDAVFLWVGFHNRRFYKSDFILFGKFALIYIGFCSFRSFFLIHLPVRFFISDIVFLFKYIFTSFLFCAILKEKAIPYVAKVIYHLALISLPLYCLQLVAGDFVYSFGKMLNLPYAHFDGYVNMIFFTYVKVHAIRNSGFSWEPGAFGFFLVIGLLLNLMINGFTFDRRIKVMAVALITTLSTTSYIGLMLVILLFFRARGVKFAKLLVFIVPLLVVFATTLPFLFDKIALVYGRDMEDLKNIQMLNQTYIDMGQIMPLNRFATLLFLYKTLGVNLIWGVSNIYRETIPILKNMGLSNGIFTFFSMYGVVGLSYLLTQSFKTFKKLSGNREIAGYCVLILLILGFSEIIFVTSLVLAFLFTAHYTQPEALEEPGDVYEPPGPLNLMRVDPGPVV